MAAPWAAKVPEQDQQKLLQEKLARAKAMKPGGADAPPQPSPESPSKLVVDAVGLTAVSPPPSPGLVVAPWSSAADGGEDMAPLHLAPGEEVPVTTIQVGGESKQFRFQSPFKVIKSSEDMQRFREGTAYAMVRDFILSLNDSCKSKQIGSARVHSPGCTACIAVLRSLSRLVDQVPPIQQPMRYGNKAFRDWFDKAAENIPQLVEEMLPANLKPAAVEVAPYLLHSLGNKTRIDYGTGHEHTFICFLTALAQIGFFVAEDAEALALGVFWEYLQLARKLQLSYRLEPAGSHGCWSLDDYQFVPFMWGSAQLMDHPSLVPSSIHEDNKVRENAGAYYYMHCVEFIKEVKSGHISENSPMINDISAVATWKKVNKGMCTMFFAEVMDKQPVMQHMLFGSILPPP